MGKVAKKYLKVDPWKIIEEGYHKDRAMVSESLFSLSNEYMGIRGFFDEGISSTDTLVGSYFNGIYDLSRDQTTIHYKGIVQRSHFMVNSVNYFNIKLKIDGETLDLNKINFKDFYRELSFKSGVYVRKFTWITRENKEVNVEIERMLSLTKCHNAIQKVTITPNDNIDCEISFILSNESKQWGGESYFNTLENNTEDNYTLNETLFTKQKVLVKHHVDCDETGMSFSENNNLVKKYRIKILANENKVFTRYVTCITSKETNNKKKLMIEKAIQENKEIVQSGYNSLKEENIEFFSKMANISDIDISGNNEDLQGIRYCIYMLNTTYHGYSEFNNIGAKGLTGEAYSGHAFWDSETYCLPYYLFNNKEATKNLILFRYNTIEEAKQRAKDLDCDGACYPIATLNGTEACTLWQHASLQFQPSTAVAYAIYHYYNLYKDVEFLEKYGYEMLLEIGKFLISRGQYNNDKTKFGYYAVMGPDEFKMMVNHNAYTNIMAKFVFDFIDELKTNKLDKKTISKVEKKVDVAPDFFNDIKEASSKMELMYDDKTKLFEQNEGFFTLPHIDIHAIPEKEFPLYSNWSYDRIYRGDMIKQPDVLMFMFLFMTKFSKEQKEANYNYYEPRCIHESSLSPSIHSVFASEIGKDDEAMNFFGFASRLDLDDYNNNTREGLHMTSIAAARVNIVYGFGGLRSDGDQISIYPKLPNRWNSYNFKITVNDVLVNITVNKDKTVLETASDKEITLIIYDKEVTFKGKYEASIN